MLRNYIEIYERNNILDKFSTIFIGICVGIITSIFTKIGTSDYVINKLYEFILSTNSKNTTGTISFILDVGTNLIIITNLIIFFISEFNKDKRRLEVIRVIIDSIIKDIEDNKSSTNLLKDTE